MLSPFAFPCAFDLDAREQRGMELRDYFAAQALVGLLMQQSNMTAMKAILEGVGIEVHAAVSGLAYNYADAMLAAREKGGA